MTTIENYRDDFNSLAAALTYDLRIPPKEKFWLDWGAQRDTSNQQREGVELNRECSLGTNNDECGPPLVGIRPLEFILWGGLGPRQKGSWKNSSLPARR